MAKSIVILNGSPRQKGNTSMLVKAFTDHYLYICEVEKVYGNEAEGALFAWNGYSKTAPAKQG